MLFQHSRIQQQHQKSTQGQSGIDFGNGLTFTTNKWTGAWGNGYFQRRVGFINYSHYYDDNSLTDYYAHPSAHFDPLDTDRQSRWEDLYDSWYASLYETHPLVRDVSRRTMGYCRMLYDDYDAVIYDQVKEAVEYLVETEFTDGTFYWWINRSKPPRSFETYSHANGLLALTEAYWLFKEYGDFPSGIDAEELKQVIHDAAHSLKRYNLEYYEPHLSSISLYHTLLDEEKQPDVYENANYRAYAIWSLSEAYKITGDPSLKAFAMTIFDHLKPYQQPDGSWQMVNDVNPYHDTRSYYHGIILSGLSSLYSTLTSADALKPDLEERIVRSINHIIDYNGVLPAESRLNTNGRVYTNHRDVQAPSPRIELTLSADHWFPLC